MTRRRIIEGTWTCGECDSKNKGRFKECPSCGSPREKHEAKFDFGGTRADGSSTGATVTEAKSLELANAGVDWVCTYCGASNRGDFNSCVECGGSREGASEVDLATPKPPPTRSQTTSAADDDDDLEWEAPAAAAVGLSGCSMMVIGGLLVAVIAVVLFIMRPVSVEATVVDHDWIRQIVVERLTPTDEEGWKDRMDPQVASTPGSAALVAGTGQTYGCETKTCWPRPPEGQGLGRVTGRSWSRTINTKTMSETSGSGWKERVPSGYGSYPSYGKGGSAGVYGGANCHRKERKAESCRNVSKQVPCGTTQSCTVRDLGNGFAEEVCTDHTKYCSESERVCDPAEYDQWCSWTELHWSGGRSVSSSGTLDRPYWPKFTVGSRENMSRSGSYTVHVEPLAGPVKADISVSSDAALMEHVVGKQYFFEAGGRSTAVPRNLVRRGEATDCEDGIPRDVLTTRDWCKYETWRWVDDPPVSTIGDATTQWPDIDLEDNGREKRDEWVELLMKWKRGKKIKRESFKVDVAEGERWPLGRSVPVLVEFDGDIREWQEGKPVSR